MGCMTQIYFMYFRHYLIHREKLGSRYTADNYTGVENSSGKNEYFPECKWPQLWHLYSDIKAFSCGEDTWLCRLNLSLLHCQSIMLAVRKPSWQSLPTAPKMGVLAHCRAALILRYLSDSNQSVFEPSCIKSCYIYKIKMKLSIEVTFLRLFKGQSLSQYTLHCYCKLIN